MFTQLMDLMTLGATAPSTSSSRSSPRGLSPSSVATRSISTGRFSAGETELLSPFYGTVNKSFHSEILFLDVDTNHFRLCEYNQSHKEESFGTQRVYKKTSPNCVLTMYLPTREISLVGNNSSILSGIVFVDPKAIQGCRVYAQLTLTFRYGREDEEVMGLRFCNEAIMSLHQVWPRNDEPSRESLSPLQDALVKRLGEGAHPFTLTLTPNAPPSVQLVPAKRYYGAPIGTSYDVRCFIADKTDEKFHRRASVKMGVRVIYRADVFHSNGLDNLTASLFNSSHQQHRQTVSPPPLTAALTTPPPPSPQTPISRNQESATSVSSGASDPQESIVNISSSLTANAEPSPTDMSTKTSATTTTAVSSNSSSSSCINNKLRKSDRVESFSRLRLSPKAFRFSGRFGRSKSEVEKYSNESGIYNYSKSFQECDSIGGGGPQGAIDKPFLLQDGRVGLRASLDKAWYSHGEEVCVTVNIRNESRKTVRKIRVCAIQHVDVCMFNNGKFKNIVADSDNATPAPDRTVPPGGTLKTTIILKPQRGPTKNWIALEDTLQRSTEPDEITGCIAASAIHSPLVLSKLPGGFSPGSNVMAEYFRQLHQQQQQQQQHDTVHDMTLTRHQQQVNTHQQHHQQQQHHAEDRNVFAIYVSYYVKVKLTLSGMGGELSLKLPFLLVHVDEEQRQQREHYLKQEVTKNLVSGENPKTSRTEVNDCRNNNNSNNNKALTKDGCSVDITPTPTPTTTTAGIAGNTVFEKNEAEQYPSHLDTSAIEDIVDYDHDDGDELRRTMSTTKLSAFEITQQTTRTRLTSISNGSNNNNNENYKRRLLRSETLARDEDEDEENIEKISAMMDNFEKTGATIPEGICEVGNFISKETTAEITKATESSEAEEVHFNSMNIVVGDERKEDEEQEEEDEEEESEGEEGGGNIHVVQVHHCDSNTSQEQQLLQEPLQQRQQQNNQSNVPQAFDKPEVVSAEHREQRVVTADKDSNEE